jgi:hypothetical protein
LRRQSFCCVVCHFVVGGVLCAFGNQRNKEHTSNNRLFAAANDKNNKTALAATIVFFVDVRVVRHCCRWWCSLCLWQPKKQRTPPEQQEESNQKQNMAAPSINLKERKENQRIGQTEDDDCNQQPISTQHERDTEKNTRRLKLMLEE